MKTHKTEIRVRYEETDKMGVVYYANHLVWFEVARTEHFRALGFPYTKLEKEGIRIMVATAACTYKMPATYDDLLTIESRIEDVKNTSLSFTYDIFRDKDLIATGRTGHVFTDDKAKPIRIPSEIRESFSASGG